MSTNSPVTLRCELWPGDLGRLTELHGLLYAEEYGFDNRFEAYVAGSLGEIVQRTTPARDRLWLAEAAGRLVGSVGILGRENDEAQLRWFLVHPDARRRGLGGRLLREALDFSRAAGFRSVYLWTVSPLADAARLYTGAGFHLTEETPEAAPWGVRLREQRYDLEL